MSDKKDRTRKEDSGNKEIKIMKKKCPKCGKYMVNVADPGQCPMWECIGSDSNGNACNTSADGEP